MSSWSASRRGRGSTAVSRAQVEPTAALVAVIAVCLAISLYAGVLNGVLPSAERDLAPPALHRIADAASEHGVLLPADLTRAYRLRPAGYSVNVTLIADRRWEYGPALPAEKTADATADAASRLVSVRRGPGRIVPGTLRVEVWR